jgi:hypothetical protein
MASMMENFWVSFIVQVVLAIVLLVIVFWIARWTMGNDVVEVQGEPDEHSSVVILPGEKSTKDDESIFLTTMVANNLNKKLPFVYLSPSLDRDGGAQFTYSFWFKVEPGSVFDTVLFLRGDKKRSAFINTRKDASDPSIMHPVAFCPMVRAKMDSGGDLTITAQINSNDEYNNVTSHVVKNRSTAYDVSEYHLVCVSCVDGELHGQERGTICKIWYDQIPIQKFFKDANVKQNGGNLYINPDFENQGAKAYPKSTSPSGKGTMRNLSYHNYAFNSDDVYALMSQESVMLGKPYVQKPDSGNNDYMRRALSLQQQHIF